MHFKQPSSAQFATFHCPFAFLGQAVSPLSVFSFFDEEPASLDAFLHRHAELSGERGFLQRHLLFFIGIHSHSL